ncbi:MAG: hypothetical protein K5884_04575 [Ruminococcus sp.]|uniref:hypothetical protein n=1 Tax=uncultured Ruminococcus sp. TaxID=165186 RepID=UPI00262FFC4F|nr:hypothetical protein [uncultured Ruminococcus sp.]MCR4861877.1 hypothetical protein [Ruminococcus sp.]
MDERKSKLSVVPKVLLILLFGVFLLILGILVDESFLDIFSILPSDTGKDKNDEYDNVQ